MNLLTYRGISISLIAWQRSYHRPGPEKEEERECFVDMDVCTRARVCQCVLCRVHDLVAPHAIDASFSQTTHSSLTSWTSVPPAPDLKILLRYAASPGERWKARGGGGGARGEKEGAMRGKAPTLLVLTEMKFGDAMQILLTRKNYIFTTTTVSGLNKKKVSMK